jgi:dTDP-4-dehydrorhamnose 3,5-epimerase
MNVTPMTLPEVLVLEPRIFPDSRGHFLETYQESRYQEFGIPSRFVQDNLSRSHKGVLRGLHYQIRQPQGKLIWVVQGVIFDVVVDVRKSSPHFGQWAGIELDSQDYRQVYIPPGFAHGFCVLSSEAIVIYKVTDFYAPQEERGIRWDDLSLGINWPTAEPIVSPKDRQYPGLKEILPQDLPA